ncbi:hypothetical protein ACFL6C_06140 [Myxococcota bacterium]
MTYVRLYGAIDETFVPTEVFGDVPGRDVILNLKAVTRLSSFGVRGWVNAMKELRPQVDRVSLVQCSPAVVSQLNMVSNFSGGAAVVSVQVPFYCEQCSWDTDLTMEVAPQLADGSKLPQVECKRCNNPMVLDDDVASYFAFTNDASVTAPDPAILSFMQDFEAAIDGASEGPASSVEPTNQPPGAAPAPPAAGAGGDSAGGRTARHPVVESPAGRRREGAPDTHWGDFRGGCALGRGCGYSCRCPLEL